MKTLVSDSAESVLKFVFLPIFVAPGLISMLDKGCLSLSYV
jgi:hypothetical protein